MSRKGASPDNVRMEDFLRLFKREFSHARAGWVGTRAGT